MKNILVCLLAITLQQTAMSQSPNETAIIAILDRQITAWNEGNLEKFMEGYWNNDSLQFVGKSGVTYGYGNTLANYKKSFPDTISMGRLSFSILQVKQLSPEYYFVVGKYYLNRSIGDVQGHYTLLFRRIGGKWKIISDHSS